MKTFALVIGVDDYHASAKLDNAVNDSNSMAETFIRLGFEVIHIKNFSSTDSANILETFRDKIKDCDASIFYFAGHGFELDGENFLASKDCQIPPASTFACSRECISLSEIVTILKANSKKVNIVILDACRKGFTRGSANSFKPIEAPQGTLIAYSTSPNEAASDYGKNGHSIYTNAMLSHIGKEYISVEELFKKVRRTVYEHSEGRQTTWEHTSLIGNFYFNEGQLQHSVSIPYDSKVIADSKYINSDDDFGKIITGLASHIWVKQNEAIDDIDVLKKAGLNKNQLFLLGKNLYQAYAGGAFKAKDFFEKLEENLEHYFVIDENHLLNGILFEIYFNKYGDFRGKNIKYAGFEQIIVLRHKPKYSKSFEFIKSALLPYMSSLYFIPLEKDKPIDVEILAKNVKISNPMAVEETWQVIKKISIDGDDITDRLMSFCTYGIDEIKLKEEVAVCIASPRELINLLSNVNLEKIRFEEAEKNPFETFNR